MSRRTEKLASAIRTAIAEILQKEVSDPRIASFVSITRVKPAPDLSSVHVYFSIMGPDAARRTSMAGLQNARKYVQGLLGRRLRTRNTPELIFHEDHSIKRGDETLRLIDEAMAELEGGATPAES
jgi:ribosome-binding factor A